MTAPVVVSARPSERPRSFPPGRLHGDACTLVILGAAGDLSRRKLLPAIYDLAEGKLLAPTFSVLGVGLEDYDDASFRALMRAACETSDEIKKFDPEVWAWLEPRLAYVRGNFTDGTAYDTIGQRLRELEADVPEAQRNRLFYLAVPPSIFVSIVVHLAASGLAPRIAEAHAAPWVRVVVEKPFGHSLATALELNRIVLQTFAEHQVYRIDHYLGKETVQNILLLRFANTIFDPLWNRTYISHVQITAAETVGVEARGRYYEEAGVVRDMFQNHLLQLLALTAMEPPIAINADAVRDEKVKVFRSIRPFAANGFESAVRAQYGPGECKGQAVPGYRSEANVATESTTPTYGALKVMVDNWRWKNVPFYLRSGKRMGKRVSEIAVQFKTPPHAMFSQGPGYTTEPNVLVMRVQPNDGVTLRFDVKIPGAALALTPEIESATVDMDFSYAKAFGEDVHPAYETLLLDVMIGDATLFTRSDEVEAAWRVTDPLLVHWEGGPQTPLPQYAAGSSGPAEADALLARDGFAWRKL